VKRYTMKNYEIFRDNGKWVAVRSGLDGVRRNIAMPNCQTKRDAIEDARRDRDFLNDVIGGRYETP
jgi:hypothetical protein